MVESGPPVLEEEEQEDSAVRLEAVSDNFACLQTGWTAETGTFQDKPHADVLRL